MSFSTSWPGACRRFILEPADLPARVAALDERDFDARWRVGELYCGNDTWRDAVRALMARSDVATMDLRGFGPENQGCVFELHSLLDLVPAQHRAAGGREHEDGLPAHDGAVLPRPHVS